MPIRKFRSLPDDDMGTSMAPDDPRLPAAIRAAHTLAQRLCPPNFPPGVYKHRSIKALNLQTEEWERRTVDRQAKNRVGSAGAEPRRV